jgi:hypothetical protein
VKLARRGILLSPAARRRCRLRIRAIDPELGFNDNSVRARQVSAEQAAVLTEMVGAGIHRLGFDWRFVEQERDRYTWSDYDRIYAAMRARGIRPLFVLLYAPAWARDSASSCDGELTCRFPPAREYLGQWREIAALLATRYPEAAGIEIWNEPNETDFWRPTPDPVRYTGLLREAYTAIKAVNPRMPVITGGFSNRAVTTGDGRLAMAEFIEGMYANGGAGHFDALGFHAYPGSIEFENYDRTLREARAAKARHGDSAIPLWVTETGFSTTGSDPVLRLSEPEQATATVELYRRLKSEPDVRAIILHTLIEPLGSSLGRDPGFGLIRLDGRPKPGYCALVQAVRGVDACP